MIKKLAPKSAARTQSPRPAPDSVSTRTLAPTELLLDPNNPRLPPGERGKSQTRLIQLMLERFDIAEIAESICSAGFLPLDPFIGYEEHGTTYILEGNRRLATIKLLLDPSLVPDEFRRTWSAFNARLRPEDRQEMAQIDVRVYQDRRDVNVLSYIGYRHVNGVMSWEAEEKAAFIAQLIEDDGIKWTYADVAAKLGSKPNYVEKLYVAHRLIEQAKEEKVPGHDRMRKQFGVLTRALQSPGVTKFLEIGFPGDPTKSQRPSNGNDRNLEDFVRWTFGTDSAKPVLEDSRDLTKWGQALSSTESVRYLRAAKDPRFDRAFAKSGGPKEGLIDALMSAGDYLEEAVPLVRQHKQDTEVKNAVARCTDYLYQILLSFPDLAKDQGLELHDATSSPQ